MPVSARITKDAYRVSSHDYHLWGSWDVPTIRSCQLPRRFHHTSAPSFPRLGREQSGKPPDAGTVKKTSIIPFPGAAIKTISAERSNIKETKLKLEWDAFICHASEDKDKFVRQLAKALGSKGLKIWYDELTLKVGDSLRQSIENGLVKSRYGIIILSPAFFAKKWPKDELNGLNTKERDGEKVILPVWLNVNEKYIAEYSPILADRLAAQASDGMEKVVSDLLDVINPQK